MRLLEGVAISTVNLLLSFFLMGTTLLTISIWPLLFMQSTGENPSSARSTSVDGEPTILDGLPLFPNKINETL